MTEKLVITGMGAVTPIGIGVDSYWTNLLAGECGISEVEGLEHLAVKIAGQCKDFAATDYLPKKKTNETSRFMQLAYAAAEEAIAMSGIEDGSTRTGIMVGTALDGFTTITETQKKYISTGGRRTDPRLLPKCLGNIAACQIAMAHSFTGPSMTVNTACASGGDAILMAACMLRGGMADAMVVAGGECGIDEIMMQSLILTKALSPTGSRPFDETRDGFVIGEGGGALVIETESHALARGADIICELAGWGNTIDDYNVVAPKPDGEGEMRCINQAMETAGIKAEDIGYINAHGTATHKGDEVECHAIAELFGKNVLVGSTKGATAHMMGAGGITEVITCIKAVTTGTIPRTTGLETPFTDEVTFVRDTVQKEISYAMSNAFGFGGQNSSIIVGKYVKA